MNNTLRPSIRVIRTCAADAGAGSISTLLALGGCPRASLAVNRAPSFELKGLVRSSCERLALPALPSRFTLEFVSICTKDATQRQRKANVTSDAVVRSANYHLAQPISCPCVGITSELTYPVSHHTAVNNVGIMLACLQ